MTHQTDDVKNLGAFQMLTPDQCVAAICSLIGYYIILEPLFR